MDPIVSVILAVAALVVGLACGWMAATRHAAPLRSECDELRRRYWEDRDEPVVTISSFGL